MKAWLYKRLNHEAKAWPYYKHDRAKQRESIRNDMRTIRAVLKSPSAYQVIGNGGNALHYDNTTLSGYGPYDVDTYLLLGIPTIDMTVPTVRTSDLTSVVISGPMCDPKLPRNYAKLDPNWGRSMSYLGLVPWAANYADIGCAVLNIPELVLAPEAEQPSLF